jgi:hypothetical protein
MIQELMYKKFMTLSERKQLDFLYTALVDKNHVTLSKKYGPKEISVIVDDDIVIIEAATLPDARIVRDSMIMSGMILLDEHIQEHENGVQCDYAFEGHAQPICLN